MVRTAGVSTNTSAEAMGNVTGAKYQVTSPARRFLDPLQPWHILDGATTVAYADIVSIDFLFGEVELTAPAAGAVTWNGNYLPMSTSETLAEAKGFTLNESADVLDKTVFNDNQSRLRRKVMGLRDATLSIDLLLNPTDDAKLATYQSSGGILGVEINFGHTPLFRGIGRLESLERSGNVEGLLESVANWTMTCEKETTSGRGFFYGYSDRSLTSS